jgi:ribosome-associated toxin RatA of RatAB toxin-antitoxin module
MAERSRHSITIPAPLPQVYGLVADVTRWPVIFTPTVHVEVLSRAGAEERFRIWALANDTVKTWTSRRHFDPTAATITFRQEQSQPPAASMAGTWTFAATDAGTEVTLLHEFAVIGDEPYSAAWLRAAVNDNSNAELAGLARAAATPDDTGLIVRFADSTSVAGPVSRAYEFIAAAELWPQRLPHVSAMDLTVDSSGAQHLSMTTSTPDGEQHVTSSVRVCLEQAIVYKQTRLPRLLTAHSGRWIFAEHEATTVTSEHTIAIDPDAVERVLGRGATLADARQYAREALGANSRITLEHARHFAGVAPTPGQA